MFSKAQTATEWAFSVYMTDFKSRSIATGAGGPVHRYLRVGGGSARCAASMKWSMSSERALLRNRDVRRKRYPSIRSTSEHVLTTSRAPSVLPARSSSNTVIASIQVPCGCALSFIINPFGWGAGHRVALEVRYAESIVLVYRITKSTAGKPQKPQLRYAQKAWQKEFLVLGGL